MIYIDKNAQKIVEASEIHYKYFRYIIKKKLNGKNFKEDKPFENITFIKQVTGISSIVKDYLNDEVNLKKILIGQPIMLNSIKSIFKSRKQIRNIKSIINYEGWDDISYYSPYDLAKKIDIPTCPYCNRLYTKTVVSDKKDKITRPTFDHWFPQAKYPLLALSFYNLIPSCSVCNSSVKGSDDFIFNKHFHPYLNHPFIEKLDYNFSYEYSDSLKNYIFKIDCKNELSKNTVDAFKLVEIYKTHEDEIKDLVHLRDIYSNRYLNILYEDILKQKVSQEDIYRLAFGTQYNEENFDRRPLSKMKKDILKELGIIPPN